MKHKVSLYYEDLIDGDTDYKFICSCGFETRYSICLEFVACDIDAHLLRCKDRGE